LRKFREIKIYDDLSDGDLLNLLQFEGKAITKDSMLLWKGAIVHEMGHIVHKHSKQLMIFLGTIGSLITAYSVALMHQSKSLQEWLTWLGRGEAAYVAPASIILGAVLFFSGPLWREHEMQADDELIERSKDPEVLKTTAKMFQSAGKLHHLKDTWKRLLVNFLHYFDPHPPADERAAKIKQAYCQKMAQNTQRL
jgi:Zn-dependent protease with chaperone function